MTNLNTQKEEKTHKADKFLYRYFYLVIIFVVLLILAVGYFFLILPKYTIAMENINDFEKNNNNVVMQLDNYIKKAEAVNDYYAKLTESDYKKIKNIFVRENFDQLYSQLELLVLQKGLELESLEIREQSGEDRQRIVVDKENEDDENSDASSLVTIKMDVIGSNYSALKNLIASLENTLPLFDIQKINFSPMQRIINLEFNTYKYNN